MHKLLFILLLFSITATVNAQKIDRKATYKYSENVDFTIFRLTKQRTLDRGSGYHSKIIIAEKGTRFITMIFEFKNNSSEPQIIDFEKFFLKNSNSKLHKVDLVVMSMKLTTNTQKYQQKLKAGKKKKIVVQFRPAFDKDETIKHLVIDDKTIELKYK